MSSEDGVRHYTAFISYRHAEEDTRVAREVHRKLERYHLDRAVREQTGIKSLAPIFRDEEELSISAELSRTLVNALNNSDALIVICSPRTKLSPWVGLEIEEFLRTHDRSRVFTVLCEGEPADVIPEVLMYTVDEHGERVETEPLAADFRESKRGLERAQEVTRLAAGILNVPYDALAKRAMRRTQRMAALLVSIVLTASFGFGAYNMYMHARLTTSYRNTMIRRSEFLASEAHTLIDEGNVIGAVELALAALPGAGPEDLDDIPVTPDAVYALQRATSSGVADGMLGRVLTMTDTLAVESDLVYTAASSDGRYVAMSDNTYIVTLWDRTTRSITYQGRERLTSDNQLNNRISCLLMTDSGKALIVYSTFVLCRDVSDGEVLWRYYLKEGGSIDACLDEATQSKLALLTDEGILVLDVDTGEEVSTLWTEDALEAQQFQREAVSLSGIVNSMDDSFVAAVTISDPDFNTYCLTTTIDGSGNVYSSLRPSGFVFSADIFPDDSLLVLHMGKGGDAASTYGEFFSHPYIDTIKSEVLLTCLDSRTGEVRWELPLTVSQIIYGTTFFEVYDDDATAEVSTVACIFSDRILYVDPRTGDVSKELMTDSSITAAREMGDKRILGVESDGSVFLVDDESWKARSYKALKASDQECCIDSDGSVFLARENILYVYDNASTELRNLANANVIDDTSYELATEDGFLIVDEENDAHELVIGVYNLTSEHAAWNTTLAEGLHWQPINYDADAQELYVVGFEDDTYEKACAVARVSADRRSVKRWRVESSPEAGMALPTMEDDVTTSTARGIVVGTCPVYHGGVVYSQVVDGSDVTAIAAASLEEGTTTFHAVPKEFAESQRISLAMDPVGNHLLFQVAKDQSTNTDQVPRKAALLDLRTGDIEVIDRLLLGIIRGKDPLAPNEGHVAWSDDGSMVACAAAGGVNVHTFGGNQDSFIKLDANRLVGMVFYDGSLVVALSSGSSVRLESYDPPTGIIIYSSVPVEGSTQYTSEGWVVGRWQAIPWDGQGDGSGDLFVTIGDNAYLVDGDRLSVCQSYAGGCAYNPRLDMILYRSVQSDEYNVEPRFTLEELITLGKGMLGDKTMGKEWLMDHGAM